ELLSQGRRLEDLDLMDGPTAENLAHDYSVLRRLGALALEGGKLTLTEVGEAMTDVPLDVALARMLVAARTITEDDPGIDAVAIQTQVAAATAIQQVHGILSNERVSARQLMRNRPRKETLSTEASSDILHELDIFEMLFRKQQELFADSPANAEANFDNLMTSIGVLPNRYYKARRTFEEVCRREHLEPTSLHKPTDEERHKILACQLIGTEELFVRKGKQAHLDIRGDRRSLGRKSVVSPALAELVMGTPFDFVGLRKTGRFGRRFIVGASTVSLELVQTYAPQRLTERSAGYIVSRQGTLLERKAYFFDNKLNIAEVEETPAPTLATREALITAMMTGVGRSSHNALDTVPFNPGTPNAGEAIRQWRAAQKMEHRSTINLNTVKRYQSLIKKVVRESLDIPLEVIDPAQLDAIIPKVYLNSLVRPTRKKDLPDIVRKSPDGIAIHIDEETKEYTPVTYKNNIAHVTISREQMETVTREDFAQLLTHHDVKIRIGTDKYLHFEAAFERIEELRQAQAIKRERREQQRALEAEAAAHNPGVATMRGRSLTEEDRKEAQVKALNARPVPTQRRKSRHLLMRSTGEPND
ncbi:MAG TPA: hypothetical protein VG992_00480, partial [Candidatus Saccharimonadales bacterium]|nr:hypothetical protein [Candidatus Saccharimonadales bacterium]